ncbi:helix-turn-helix transcriptional regulator [Streptacidiphilus sp. P02-A3a]|nr:helix-turn-helix transcriptional regulator [Streptacidiphilus sp. P02-A3a]
MRSVLPEVTALEAWRLALGWSRAQAIRQVAAEYRADGLQPTGLSEAMLCRYEHGQEDPGPEYKMMIARAYGARVDQLGLATRCFWCTASCTTPLVHYGQTHGDGATGTGVGMTTASGMPAVRESLQLALLDAPGGSPAVTALAQAAVEHYALNYSKHPPAVLLDEVRGSRQLLAAALGASTEEQIGVELRRQIGWLSALLGNLSHHLADDTGARTHLTLAVDLGERTGDAALAGWASGALAMVATARQDWHHALDHAQYGLGHAPGGLRRAQLLGWAQLPALAGLGDAEQVDAVLAEADLILQTAGETPGRFGYDLAEHRLHAAEAHLTLERYDRAAEVARESVAAAPLHTPGWAAATLVLALAEAPSMPGEAASRALDVLDRIPPARLRATARARLARLNRQLATTDHAAARDLIERLRLLPAPIGTDGSATA